MSEWIDLGRGVFGKETTSGWILTGNVIYVADSKKKLKPVAPVVPPVVVPPVEPPHVVPPISGVRQPRLIQNMELVNGVYRSKPGWERMMPKITCLEYSVPEIQYGSIVEVRFNRRANFQYTGLHNIKPFRAYKDKTGDYPNFYMGKPPAGGWMFYVEDLPVTSNTRFYGAFPAYTETFRHERWQWQVNSGPGKADGRVSVQIGGVQVFESDAFQFDSESRPGVQRVLCVQDYLTGETTVPEGSWIEYTPPVITVL